MKSKSRQRKHFENIIWIDDETPLKFKNIPYHRDEWETMFDAMPYVNISFKNAVIKPSKFDEYVRYFLDKGFTPRCQDDSGIIPFINIKNEILISSFTETTWKSTCRGGSSDVKYIEFKFHPHTKNKLLIEDIFSKIEECIEYQKVEDNCFYMIASNGGGLYNQKTEFNAIPIKDDRYDLYYGKEFPLEKLKSFITKSKTSGNLMLLHGESGAGKSNLIKNLIKDSPVDVIYIPPSMVSVISQPSFVSYMLENKSAILLIEDAEQILSADRNSATNNLLNLTSGFLEDALSIKVIASFNCDIGKIDPALLRKGRLFYEHSFTKLSCVEAQGLAKFCDLDVTIENDMTIADVFNMKHQTSKEDNFKERSIGFR